MFIVTRILFLSLCLSCLFLDVSKICFALLVVVIVILVVCRPCCKDREGEWNWCFLHYSPFPSISINITFQPHSTLLYYKNWHESYCTICFFLPWMVLLFGACVLIKYPSQKTVPITMPGYVSHSTLFFFFRYSVLKYHMEIMHYLSLMWPNFKTILYVLFTQHPVTWKRSNDGKFIIGHMILSKTLGPDGQPTKDAGNILGKFWWRLTWSWCVVRVINNAFEYSRHAID